MRSTSSLLSDSKFSSIYISLWIGWIGIRILIVCHKYEGKWGSLINILLNIVNWVKNLLNRIFRKSMCFWEIIVFIE
jgi:hypothetical protein